ncbi:MAG: segregation/condensation protein A [Firmicutes bacterium]|nr:segregation/condensation protein A [Bacillota bacterium]MBQ9016586.1 segregation/condensation protein A [Bacillota bacterium]
MSYRVRLNVFEGPFDLLVYLIEHAQMSIYDIRISEITEQYVEYISRMQEADINVSTEFMVLAAELLEIKSKMLLPRSAPSEDGETAYEDPRTELVARLREYKLFKELSHMLEERQEQTAARLEKPQEDLSEFTGEPDEYLSLDMDQFTAAFEAFLQRKKNLEEIRAHHIRTEKQRITTELRMNEIRTFFRDRQEREADFRDLVPHRDDRYDISVTFSSVLEMVKEHRLEAEQKKLFGDIKVTATDELFEQA